ncbi:chitooligosaccharide deacetylase [Diplocarpon rosae]|nr:chitooligosaccharide deacetylase [Diplocarpon rosae]
MRLNSLTRKLRRLGITDVWFAIYTLSQRSFPGSPSIRKHIKIDDEESQCDAELLRTQHHPIYRAMIRLLYIVMPIVLLLLSIAYIVYRPPNLVIRLLQWHNGNVIFHVPLSASQRVVALTIDDAPSSETRQILDLLRSHHAKATFFVIGSQVARYPGLVERIHAEGHELGNHAWTDDPSFQLPLSELERQIQDVESLLPANANGAKYFRPGSGWFTARMKERIERLGYRVALGSVYPHDPQIPKPRWNAWHVLSMVRPGSVVIVHDRRAYSAEQLRLILEGLGQRKFGVESLGGLLALAGGKGKRLA